MVTTNVEERSLTVEEYLRFEDASAERHEYVAGRVYAMSGGSARHVLITGNVLEAVRRAARGGPCLGFGSDLRLRVAADTFYCSRIAIGTLRLYLIVEQDQRLVERHWRDGSGTWQHEHVTDASGGRIPVSAPSTILTLDTIYEGIDLPAADPAH